MRFPFALAFALLLASCGASDASDPVASPDDSAGADAPSTAECPPGGAPPVEGPEGIPENCEVLFEGCCFITQRDACLAAGCAAECEVMESYPGQVRRCD